MVHVTENCYFRLPILLLHFYFKMKLLSTFFVLFLSVVTSNSAGSMRKVTRRCPDIANLTVSFLAAPPYVMLDSVKNSPTGALSNFIKSILQKCFHQWKCEHGLSNVTWQRIDSAEDLYQIVQTEQTDIAFAFPPSLPLPKLHLMSRAMFTEIIKSPGFALAVDKTNCRNAARQSMWKNIISYWPIFLLMFILSWSFGILMWILETRSNEKEFPRTFFQGIYEGFWWAVISMTSVGYGDKVPRTMSGKLFGVIWILFGVVLISVVTAAITSVLTVASVDYKCNTLQGKRIAVFNDSEAERIANHHGAVVTGYTSFDSMSTDVKLDVQDGILLDQFRASYYLSRHRNNNLRVSKLIQHSLSYKLAFVDRGRHLLPLRNNCFVENLESASAHYRGEKFIKKYVKPLKSWEPATNNLGMFGSGSKFSENMLLVSTYILVSLLVLGVLWHLCNNRSKCHCGLSQAIPRQRLQNFSNVETFKMGTMQESVLKKVNSVERNLITLTAEIQQLKTELHVVANACREINRENDEHIN